MAPHLSDPVFTRMKMLSRLDGCMYGKLGVDFSPLWNATSNYERKVIFLSAPTNTTDSLKFWNEQQWVFAGAIVNQ